MAVIFALGAGVLCLILGLSLGEATLRRSRRIQGWVRALERLETALENRLSLPEALTLTGQREMRGVAQILEKEPLSTPEMAWEKGVSLRQEEGRILRMLFARLGRGDLGMRTQAVRQARQMLEELGSRIAAQAERDRPLYRSFGWLGGMAVTLLLL